MSDTLRTRSRSLDSDDTGEYNQASWQLISRSSGSIVNQSIGAKQLITTRSSVIVDENPALPGYDSLADHYCAHQKQSCVYHEYDYTYHYSLASDKRVFGSWAEYTPAIPTPLVLNWGPALTAFVNQLDPKGPVGLRFFQNVWELGETIKMFTDVRSGFRKLRSSLSRNKANTSTLRDVYKLNKGTNPSSRGLLDYVSRGLDTMSNVWLGYRYGVKPLVSDIIALANTVSAVQQQVEKALRHKEDRLFVHARETTSNEGVKFWPGSYARKSNFVNKTEYVITADISWPNFYVDDGVFTDAILKYWGFDSILANLWEILPLSFVVDWAIDIGDKLSRLDLDSMNRTARNRDAVTIHRASHSTKVSTSYLDHSFLGLDGKRHSAAVMQPVASSHYIRKKGLPDEFDYPEILGGLTAVHAIDGAAILRGFLR